MRGGMERARVRACEPAAGEAGGEEREGVGDGAAAVPLVGGRPLLLRCHSLYRGGGVFGFKLVPIFGLFVVLFRGYEPQKVVHVF